MAQANLWGNATVGLFVPAVGVAGSPHTSPPQDLSLLVDLKYEDIQKLQSVGKAAQEANAKFILRNDLPKVWEHLKRMKGGRVDFVLDNGELSHVEKDLREHQLKPSCVVSWLRGEKPLQDGQNRQDVDARGLHFHSCTPISSWPISF
jgi:hypothetical protein